MLCPQFDLALQAVMTHGDTQAIKIDTPDLVWTTHEIIDRLEKTCSHPRPALYLVRPDRLTEYDWSCSDWQETQELSIDRSVEVLENSHTPPAVFIFWNNEQLMDERDGMIAVRLLLPQIFLAYRPTKKLIVFLEPLGATYPAVVTPYLSSGTVAYPTRNELVPMVMRELARCHMTALPEQADQISHALLGLTYTRARELLHLSLIAAQQPFSAVTNVPGEAAHGAASGTLSGAFSGAASGTGKDAVIAQIVETLHREKEQFLAQTLGMTILRPMSDDLPMGLDGLMDDFAVHRHRICMEGQEREKGWLLIGPPGTGKTLVGRYLAGQLGYPAITFEISSIMNSFVGQTEKNMYNYCRVLETFAPCVVYIDELEKTIAVGGEADGGTMMRAMGILFSFLNDTQAPIFVLGSANNLDPRHGLALTRKGRFSQLYWVDLPAAAARQAICRAAFARQGSQLPESLLEKLAQETRYYSGADLSWLCREAEVRRKFYGVDAESRDFAAILFQLVQENRQRVEIMKNQYDALRQWGRAYCKSVGPGPDA
ncbi:ATP-binding protein [Heliophilum fasciatum]|uniref:Uncharacterized AAA domain-containing protein ycf46 n=1 Tax=Heliophilum fasciatum TaxID=35700 RepID=A0A4R2RAA9_9FIRM|nr:ATP-binding protein [Heliophilum fasciatum]MCW2279367.1 hypothetical protein [Heliophilum fasciatum]TCP60210.1 ATPase family protein associated with various cellular activities (AAA) [Heliophilum fasciatum]